MNSQYCLPKITLDHLEKKIDNAIASQVSQLPQKDPLIVESEVEISGITDLIKHIEGLLENAKLRGSERSTWPDSLNKFPFLLLKPFQKLILKFINILFKDQIEVNQNLAQGLQQTLLINQELIRQIISLRYQSHRDLQNIHNYQQVIEQQITEKILPNSLGKIINHLHELDEKLDTQLQTIEEGLDYTKYRLEEVANENQDRGKQISDSTQDLLNKFSYLRGEISQQKKSINLFLEEAQKRLPEPFDQQQIQKFTEEEKHQLDAFYTAFEDRFRGSRDDIYQRLKVYLPFIDEGNIGKPDSPILDLGCGRGEWLELLRESGYFAKGIDINQVSVQKCQTLQLNVIESDVISYLENLPDNTLGCVSGFHIIEHLPFPMLMKLFDETVRVLKPGGLAIFETPNPENTLVGSYSFYYDPTHLNPLPSATTKFMVQYCGLCRVKILNLHPSTETRVKEDSDLAQRFNQYFYSSMDYAIVGYKP